MTRFNQCLKSTFLYACLRNFEVKRRGPKELATWEDTGHPVPPPHLVKQRALLEYAKRYGLRVLVETGTYYGDMVAAMKTHFDRIYSIELSAALYKLDVRRFRGERNIALIEGDSGVEIDKIINELKTPALFWLDGHYSGGNTARGEKDSPISEELHAVLSQGVKHVILIDDARDFGFSPAYPTIEELSELVKAKREDFSVRVKNGIIRIAPNDGYSPAY